ncbi:MAG: hypothetical protein HN344_10335, partial [Gammaproteobacteria bacterium]|nr:hypothetical protein [Gammaproteobacteria bacterium]
MKDPEPKLALRITHPDGLTWRIRHNILVVEISGQEHTVDLTDHTVTALSAHLVTLGIAVDVMWGGTLSAVALIDGEGDQSQSNGDHLYLYQNLLWSWGDTVSVEIRAASAQIGEMLRQMTVTTAEAQWLEHLCSNWYAVGRREHEDDADYRRRTIETILRPKANNIAISDMVELELDIVVRVYDCALRDAHDIMSAIGGTPDSNGDMGIPYNCSITRGQGCQHGDIQVSTIGLAEGEALITRGARLSGYGEFDVHISFNVFTGVLPDVISGFIEYSGPPLNPASDFFYNNEFSREDGLYHDSSALAGQDGDYVGNGGTRGGGLVLPDGTSLEDVSSFTALRAVIDRVRAAGTRLRDFVLTSDVPAEDTVALDLTDGDVSLGRYEFIHNGATTRSPGYAY